MAQKFFHGIKVPVRVNMLKPKRSDKGDTKTLTLTFRIPLNGNSSRSAPKFVQAGYKSVNDDACDVYGITKEFDGINSEFYTLEEHKRPEIRLSALHFDHLKVLKTTNSEGDTAIVLTFQTEYPWDKTIWEWLGDHYGTDVWAKFDAAQATLIDLEEEGPEDTQAPTEAAEEENEEAEEVAS